MTPSSPSLPQASAPEDVAPTLNKMAEGPDKLIGVPPGFTVVRSQWLNLDLGGGGVDFSVPGFSTWGGRAASRSAG